MLLRIKSFEKGHTLKVVATPCHHNQLLVNLSEKRKTATKSQKDQRLDPAFNQTKSAMTLGVFFFFFSVQEMAAPVHLLLVQSSYILDHNKKKWGLCI